MFNHVSSCFINCFTYCASYVEADSDIAEMESSDRHWFSDHLDAGESHDLKALQAHGTYSQHIRAYMLLSSFKQANLPAHFQTVHFAGTPLWDVSKLGAAR